MVGMRGGVGSNPIGTGPRAEALGCRHVLALRSTAVSFRKAYKALLVDITQKALQAPDQVISTGLVPAPTGSPSIPAPTARPTCPWPGTNPN